MPQSPNQPGNQRTRLDKRRVVGRGSSNQDVGRFEALKVICDAEFVDVEPETESSNKIATEYFEDASQSIVSKNDSPDIPFTYSVNPYRGCSHGCSYCYARPTHEYLGFGPGLDFESKIMVKPNAPELFRKWLANRSGNVESVMMSGVTDCYQPAERNLELTRGCLEAALDFRHPIQLITKNSLICRDLDLLQQLAELQLTSVAISLTSLDQSLTRVMEPRTSSPDSRLRTINTLAEAGVPVMVMTAPIIPGINDQEIPELLKRAADAGATRSGYVALRLPLTVEPIFIQWLEEHFPDAKEKVLGRIQVMRNGQLSSSVFGERMRGGGIWGDQIAQVHKTFSKKYNLDRPRFKIQTDLYRNVDGQGRVQGELF